MSAPQSYYVPVDTGEAEFTEKRSRFLGHVRRVETEAEARAFLDEMRKNTTTRATTAGATSCTRAAWCATATTASRRAPPVSRC